jgi:hypothetical protein
MCLTKIRHSCRFFFVSRILHNFVLNQGGFSMKTNRFAIFLFLIAIIALCGCEGDQGPAGVAGADGVDGTNGTDGIDGNVTCLDCHNTDTQNSISLQFDRSQHAAGTIAVDYAGARAGCAMCHSGNGYVEWAETGMVDGNLTTPEPWECKTCHSIHTTFEVGDYALRMADPVEWIFDEDFGATTFDFGDNSNVCAWCHQSRRAAPTLTNPDDDMFWITSTHWGPHHGAMANVWAGVGFAEMGTGFPTTNVHATQATCMDCHMGAYADGEGGHTWSPSLAACNACHGTTETDFNHGGVREDIEGLLDDLRDQLLANGVIEEDPDDPGHYIPLMDTPNPDDLDDDGNPKIQAHVTIDEANAFFNWVGLSEDRSLGAHNPRYVEVLLENSIAAITPAP